jgi:hypothetical protein
MYSRTGTAHEDRQTARRLLRTAVIGALAGMAAILIAGPGASAQSPVQADATRLTTPANPSPGHQTAASKCADCLRAPAANLQAAKPAITPQLEIAQEDADILELAAQLKLEVDQCRADTLQADVVRKANLIRRLAKELKDEVKLTLRAK